MLADRDFLHYVRDEVLPTDLVDVLGQAGVPFFEGCLIVEVHDHRKTTARNETTGSLFYLREGGRYGFSREHGSRSGRPAADGIEVYRIVLQPSCETLWADLRSMDERLGGLWSDDDALHAEAAILNATAPPLCLAADPHAMHIANLMQSCTMPPKKCPQTPAFSTYTHNNANGDVLNSIELEHVSGNEARHELIMGMMSGGWAAEKPRADTEEPSSFVPVSYTHLTLPTNREV